MKEGRKSAMEGVPTSLPPLNKAVRIQEKAAGMGFNFGNADEAFQKVKEEYEEFEQSGSEEEFGDLLFALVKWGAMRGINADNALSKTNRKFIERFQHIEQTAAANGKTVNQMTKEEMLQAWREAK
jgi:XTP/dITP diphosphohydrolase